MTDVVIAIATYNEAGNIAELLGQLSDYEVILVDSHSPDGTAAIARRFENVTVIDASRGIASSYLKALELALETDCEFVVQMDAGMTHDPADIPLLIYDCRRWSRDLTIGSRQFEINSYRSLISVFAAWLMRRKGILVSDATSGFRCWRTSALEILFSRKLNGEWLISEGFAFQFELLFYAHRAGVRIGEVPIEYRLTNSSFKLPMIWEAIRVYRGLK